MYWLERILRFRVWLMQNSSRGWVLFWIATTLCIDFFSLFKLIEKCLVVFLPYFVSTYRKIGVHLWLYVFVIKSGKIVFLNFFKLYFLPLLMLEFYVFLCFVVLDKVLSIYLSSRLLRIKLYVSSNRVFIPWCSYSRLNNIFKSLVHDVTIRHILNLSIWPNFFDEFNY